MAVLLRALPVVYTSACMCVVYDRTQCLAFSDVRRQSTILLEHGLTHWRRELRNPTSLSVCGMQNRHSERLEMSSSFPNHGVVSSEILEW